MSVFDFSGVFYFYFIAWIIFVCLIIYAFPREQVDAKYFKAAMETLRRFNVLLVLDFVDDEMWALEEAFGWKQARKQVPRHGLGQDRV